jgi:probable HAF family extracellular repeat protein
VTELLPDLPPEVTSVANAVNIHGEVAGHLVTLQGGFYQSIGFTWADGAGALLTNPPTESSTAVDIDRRGRVLVNRWVDSAGASVVHRGREIPSPLVRDGRPLSGVAINDRGQVIGNSYTFGEGQNAYLWEPGVDPIDLGTLGGIWASATEINDAGSVLGEWAQVIDNTWIGRAFIWRDGEIVDLGTLGGDETRMTISSGGKPDQLNERDEVTGQSETVAGETHAFLWRDGTMTDLGTLGGAWSVGFGINDHGEVVGLSETAAGELHAFLWRDGTMIDLSVLAGVTGPGESRATAINNRGQILGWSWQPERGTHLWFWETRHRGR